VADTPLTQQFEGFHLPEWLKLIPDEALRGNKSGARAASIQPELRTHPRESFSGASPLLEGGFTTQTSYRNWFWFIPSGAISEPHLVSKRADRVSLLGE
jgi:hypothetical protein